MALNRSKNMKEEGLTATVALAMAFYEQTGLRELIDSKFDIDCRQKLTPGNAVKALIGDMMGLEGRRPLYSVHNPFKTAPNDLLFGEKVDIKPNLPPLVSLGLFTHRRIPGRPHRAG